MKNENTHLKTQKRKIVACKKGRRGEGQAGDGAPC